MDAPPAASFSDRYTLISGAVFLVIGVVETFVRPQPDSLFGEAMLAFGVGMLLLWWSGRIRNTPLRLVAQVLSGVGVVLAVYDLFSR